MAINIKLVEYVYDAARDSWTARCPDCLYLLSVMSAEAVHNPWSGDPLALTPLWHDCPRP